MNLTKLALLGGLFFSCMAQANVEYFDCSARDNSKDSYPETGYLLSFGMSGGEGWYELDGQTFKVTVAQLADDKARLKGDKGDVLYGQGWANPLMSFAITDGKGNNTIFACAPMNVDGKALKEAVNDMTYPDDNK